MSRNSRSRRRTKRVRSARLAFPAVGKNGKSIIAIALTDFRARGNHAPPFAPPLTSPSPLTPRVALPSVAVIVARSVSLSPHARVSLQPMRVHTNMASLPMPGTRSAANSPTAPPLTDDRHYRFRCEWPSLGELAIANFLRKTPSRFRHYTPSCTCRKFERKIRDKDRDREKGKGRGRKRGQREIKQTDRLGRSGNSTGARPEKRRWKRTAGKRATARATWSFMWTSCADCA